MVFSVLKTAVRKYTPALLLLTVVLSVLPSQTVSERQRRKDVLQFGLESEITDLVSVLIREKDG